MYRALPAATVCAIAPQVSSSGTCGSTRWSWYRSTWSVPSRRRLPSIDDRTCSGRPSRPAPGELLPGLATSTESVSRPTLVASTARSRWPRASARPTNSSLVYGP